MKRCPECRRDYFDDSLLYCLDDGTALLEGPASGGGPTALFESSGDAATRMLDSGSTGENKRTPSRMGVPITVMAIVLVAIGGAYLAYRFYPLKKTASPMGVAKISRLTTSGKALDAAISPDGKWVVYAQKDAGQQSLWMRQTATNSVIQIVPPADVQIGRQTFSPDGNYVYYFITSGSDPSGVLYQAPTIGGQPRKILNGIASPITFSPDGKRIAFLRNDEVASGEDQLIVANADGSGERKLAARKVDTWFSYPTGCSWSPDAKLIACSGGRYTSGSAAMIIMTDSETGDETEFAPTSFTDVGRISWLADGSGLVMNGAEHQSYFDQLWMVAYPGGEAHPITTDLNDYSGASLTADSGGLVSVQYDETVNIWTASVGDMAHPKQISTGKFEGGSGTNGGISWAPDGRIVYTSLSSGNADVWVIKSDGTEQKQLTTDPAADIDPTVSPDGRFIVFVSSRGGLTGLRRMDIDGGNTKLLSDLDDHKPQISGDSKWIIFDSWRTGKRALWKMSTEGGAAVQLSDKFTSSCGISPDGKSIACFYRESERSGSPWRILILPFEGGNAVKTFDASVQDPYPLEASIGWTPDGKALTYVTSTGGIPNLWSQSIDGGPPKRMTDFKENGVWRYAFSRDNKQVAFSRGSWTSDVVLFKDFK
ncbi:MAG: hypothetical protein ACJ73D_10025 [Pyrinomonadaceae bacterium]